MQFIRKNKTAKMVGWHPVHLMREAKAGRFPAPVQIGANSVGFVEEEVLGWMAERVGQRAAEEQPATSTAERRCRKRREVAK